MFSEEIARRLQEEEDKYEDDQREAFRRAQGDKQSPQRRGRSTQDANHQQGRVSSHGAASGRERARGSGSGPSGGRERQREERKNSVSGPGPGHETEIDLESGSESHISDLYGQFGHFVQPQVAGHVGRGRSRCVCFFPSFWGFNCNLSLSFLIFLFWL